MLVSRESAVSRISHTSKNPRNFQHSESRGGGATREKKVRRDAPRCPSVCVVGMTCVLNGAPNGALIDEVAPYVAPVTIYFPHSLASGLSASIFRSRLSFARSARRRWRWQKGRGWLDCSSWPQLCVASFVAVAAAPVCRQR